MAGMEESTPDVLVTIAVDFGTRYSGYAYYIKGRGGIFACTEYGEDEATAMQYKAPTSVLLEKDGTFVAFGYDAVRTYLEEHDESKMFFENFKMSLYDAQSGGKNFDVEGAVLTARNGKKHSALEVFTHALRFLRKHSYGQLREALHSRDEGGKRENEAGQESEDEGSQAEEHKSEEGEEEEELQILDSKQIRWVLTVPAIWNNSAKFFMRKAAYKAGLVSAEEAERLVIALEPEVAALYCRQLEVEQTFDLTPDPTKSTASKRKSKKVHREFKNMDPGEKYCVIDAGGGTVDITAQEILPDGGVRQLARAFGGPHGGAQVDELFERFLEEIFTEDFMMSFKEDSPVAYQSLLQSFERNKREYSIIGKRPRLVVEPPVDFFTALKEEGREFQTIVKTFADDTAKTIDSTKTVLRFNRPTVDAELFTPVISEVVKAVQEFLDQAETRDISIFFVVGGFGKTVAPAIRKAIIEKKPIIQIPQDPGLAVLKGAVLFGTDPSIIRERTAELTYGLRIAPLFRERVHKADKKVTVEGRSYCQDVFQALIREGQRVKYGHVEHHSFANVDKDSDSFTAVIYSTTETPSHGNVIYIDENCKRIGSITVDVTAFGNDAVRIQFRVGGTELRVTAINVRTNKKTVTAVEFSAHT